jgi:YidC/Oxa1 family membrane protein insertase
MSFIYHTFIYNPLYNLLVELFNLFTWVDAGIAVVVLTIIVRLILFPLSKKSVLTQVKMKEIGPELEALKEKYKDKPEEQAKQTLALYKTKGVNPFSGIFLLLLQLPIIWALYQIFLHAGFPEVNSTILYPFVRVPEFVSTQFLGLFNITDKNVYLAVLASLSTYFQIKLAASKMQTPSSKEKSFGNDLAKSMQNQMKYFFPVIVFFIAYKISGVIALYWLTSNLFTIAQEIWIQKKHTNVIQPA